jgi:hypothetical protein
MLLTTPLKSHMDIMWLMSYLWLLMIKAFSLVRTRGFPWLSREHLHRASLRWAGCVGVVVIFRVTSLEGDRQPRKIRLK